MIIDEKSKSVLTNNLRFTLPQIGCLENNADLLSKTMGLIHLLKNDAKNQETRTYVANELKKIKLRLNKLNSIPVAVLKEARAQHYTFQRDPRWSFLPRFFKGRPLAEQN